MSGREVDPDGTDSFHPEHRWEQVGHPQYVEPSLRTSLNWPPVLAFPHGPHEALQWDELREHSPEQLDAWHRAYGHR